MKASTKSFYQKNCLWLLFCLSLAPVCSLMNTLATNISVSTNENNAVRAIAQIRTLQMRYAAKNRGRFAADFDELIRSENLNEDFSGKNPIVNGYVYHLTVPEATAQKPAFFSITADPVSPGARTRHFYYDSVIAVTRATDENRPATATDPAI